MSDTLTLFGDAPLARYPAEPIRREALIEGNYRRWLKRAWGPGPCAGWAMLNPSDANGLRDDPTLWRIMGFSYRLGFGSLVVGNFAPFISSSPKAMLQWLKSRDTDDAARDAFVQNVHDCADIFAPCSQLFAAWGNGAPDEDLALWLDMVEIEIWDRRNPGRELDIPDQGKLGIVWHCFGRTISGAPKHPLARGVHRIPDDAQPMVWRQ